MNRISLSFLLLLITFTLKAQSPPADSGVAMLKDFYTAYITAASDNESELSVSEAKMDALKRRYCTPACQKRIKALIKKTDADPIIQAQDCDKGILKTLVIKKDAKKPGRYVITYLNKDDNNAKTTIYVIVKTAQNMLKIAYFE